VVRPAHSSDEGFSIIEVLVAATVLIIGIAGTLTLLAGANSATAAVSGTEGATNLAREVIERVRQLPPSQLTPASAAGALQGMSGLADTGAGGAGTWTVTRRGTTYTLNLDVCAVDDPKDGIGPHGGATFCSGTPPAGTADAAPQDYQRVTSDVSWQSKGAAVRHLKQVVMISGRGADGPPVSAFVATSPSFPYPNAPVVSSPATTTINFKVTADTRASQVNILLDGQPATPATATAVGNGTDWTFSINVGSMTDRSYELAAQAVDARGVPGPLFAISLMLNRYAPQAPQDVVGAMNSVYINGARDDVAEFGWTANTEANVIGYRVYRPDNSLACDLRYSDDVSDHTTCMDPTPQDGTYQVAAVYQDATGNIIDGPRAPTSTTVVTAPQRAFFLDNHSVNDAFGTPCDPNQGSDVHYDLNEAIHVGTTKIQNANSADWHRFCGAPLAAAANLASGKNVTLKIYLNNKDPQGRNCPLTIGGTVGTYVLAPQQQQVTQSATPQLYTWSWPIAAAAQLPIGARPVLDLNYDTSVVCNKTEEDFNSTQYASVWSFPTVDYPAPKPPTAVHATTTSDGLQLDWTAPLTGITPAFYRIYRDGYNYDDRWGETEDATPTFTDRDDGATHTYYVTAVSDTLQESDPAPLPPATFP
jgi:type II secretory pathway pseudopilin PulG